MWAAKGLICKLLEILFNKPSKGVQTSDVLRNYFELEYY